MAAVAVGLSRSAVRIVAQTKQISTPRIVAARTVRPASVQRLRTSPFSAPVTVAAPQRASVAVKASTEEDAPLGGWLTKERRDFGLLWSTFVVYALFLAPQGTGDYDAQLVADLFTKGPLSPDVNPLWFIHFNAIGIIPAVYAAILGAVDDEDQPVPMLPFTVLSLFTGFFALGPYLIIRNPKPEPVALEDAGFIGKYFEALPNKIFVSGWGIAVFGYLLYTIATGADWSGYKDILDNSQLAAASLVDAALMSVLIIAAIKEDMARREFDNENLAYACGIPILGPALWYLIRPNLK